MKAHDNMCSNARQSLPANCAECRVVRAIRMDTAIFLTEKMNLMSQAAYDSGKTERALAGWAVRNELHVWARQEWAND